MGICTATDRVYARSGYLMKSRLIESRPRFIKRVRSQISNMDTAVAKIDVSIDSLGNLGPIPKRAPGQGAFTTRLPPESLSSDA
jgi:hypothetical protein